VFDGNRFRPVEDIEYYPDRDAVVVEYYNGRRTTLIFTDAPDEIDLDTRRIPEKMRLRWEEAVNSKNTDEMGDVGAKVAAKIAEEEYDVKVLLSGRRTGPDGEFTLNGETGVFEAKSTADKSELGDYLGDAIEQIEGRFEKNSKYKVGIAVSVYIDKHTGFFEYQHDIIHKTQGVAFTGFYPMDAGTSDQPPMGQTSAGYSGNDGRMSDARQDSGSHAMERQSTSNGQAPNMQMMRGEHSQPSYNSQPKDQLQRSSNQFSTAPTQDREQGQGSKANQIRQGSNINNSDPKKASVDNSSRTTKAQNDRQQSTFNEREGSGKGSTQQKQQIQRQGQLTKQQGNSATKEAKQASSDSSGSQQAQKKGSEKPAQANGSKGSKDSKNRVTSPRGGPIPI
jgi:hypothetical protein